MVIEVGRVCMKTAGRDAGKTCVVVDVVDQQHVLIDGATRRRNCNIAHLEPLDQTLSIKKGASHSEVEKACKKQGLDIRTTKPKKAGAKPTKVRKQKEKPAPETKEKKSETKSDKKEK